MKWKNLTRFIVLTLAASMVLTACSVEKESNSTLIESNEEQQEGKVTLGAIADYLLGAADAYNAELTRALLLEGFEEKENEPATKIEGLVMISRAFGELPVPKGNSERLAPEGVNLENVPEWAKLELQNLVNGGVLAESDLGDTENNQNQQNDEILQEGVIQEEKMVDLEPTVDEATAELENQENQENQGYEIAGFETGQTEINAGELEQSELQEDYTSLKEVQKVVRRIWALYGSDLKDDFYTNVNKEDLENKEIPAGQTDAGGTYDLRAAVAAQVRNIIQEVAAGSDYEEGSREDKIKKLYASALDFAKRNELGAEPLRKYLDLIDEASNLKEVVDSQLITKKEIISGGIFGIIAMTDFRDYRQKVLTIMTSITPMYEAEEYDDPNHKILNATRKLQKKLLMLSGETEEEAEAHVKAYFNFEKELKKYMPSAEEYQDSNNLNQIVSPEELEAMMPGVDIKSLISINGREVPSEINIQDPKLFKGFCEMIQNPDNLEGLKTIIKMNLITQQYLNLSDDFREAFDAYNEEVMGQAPSESVPEDIAAQLVENSLGEYVEQLYVEKHFSSKAKEDVENMIKSFIEVYKERIQKLDWMGEETKAKAIEKLDHMTFLIGYPDEWSNTLDSLEITDDYFENQVAIAKLNNQKELEDGYNNDRKTKMAVPATMVNAYYDQFTNTICFPAAMLQAPFYDVNASLEENLGGIGAIIAHEITHAFDNTGAKYDKDGVETDWWTQEDYKKFEELCAKTVDFYEGWESATGLAISGEKTLGENIADIGAVACTLEVLKKSSNPDYDKFFRAYAASWLKCTTRARAEALQQADEHSPNILRVNRVLSNFEEFYKTYGITEGDGMYVTPKERINIW